MLAAAPLHAAGLTDNFEATPLGSPAASPWLDATAFQPGAGYPVLPNPSATVVQTVDAFGQPTHALALVDAVGTPKGVYAISGEAPQMQVQADVRIQRFANTSAAAFGPAADSALNVGFFVADPASSPFAALYVSATTHEWRLAYSGVNSNGNFDVGTGRFADPERWYTVNFSYQEAGYSFAARVSDTLTGNVLFLNTVSFTGFQPAATDHFNAALLWGLETSATVPPTPGQATLASLTVFDNVSVSAVPEPTPLALTLAGMALLALRRGLLRRR
jgi:MYXO-CTERM domain-containing protein